MGQCNSRSALRDGSELDDEPDAREIHEGLRTLEPLQRLERLRKLQCATLRMKVHQLLVDDAMEGATLLLQDRYLVLRHYELGEGTYGKVMLALDGNTGKEYAAKEIRRSTLQRRGEEMMLDKEIEAMQRMDHPNVLRLYGMYDAEGKEIKGLNVVDALEQTGVVYLCLQFASGGDLFDIVATQGALPEARVHSIFGQLIAGVEHCHKQGICHRDLKLSNLLLDGEGRLLVADFGLATLKDGESGLYAQALMEPPTEMQKPQPKGQLWRAQTMVGTLQYTAP